MYEEFFGLVDAPFRLTPDPRYLFLSRKHEDALAHLRLGLTESGFVCITGDVGTGKTTLLRYFLSNLAAEISAAYVFNPALSATELLQTINAEFGLPSDTASKKTLTDALNAHLLELKQEGRRAVVVIDEAQALDIGVLEQLRLLSNLETATEKLLRIILVGQPQLRDLLMHSELVQLNQRITLRWHIGPLDAAETAAYVRHRLGVASHGKARNLFTPRALALLHDYAGGVPRIVNMLAHRSLVAAFAAERHQVTPRSVRKAHREVSTVPLPVVRRTSWARPALATVAAVVAVTAVGVWRFGAPDVSRVVARELEARLANLVAEPPPTPVVPPPAAAPPEPVAEATTTSTTLPVSPPEQHLTALDAAASMQAALGAVARAWRVDPPLESDRTEAELPMFGERRNIEHLPLTGNLAMLRLLDVPAILELRFPDVADSRWVTLLGLSVDRATLWIDDAAVAVGPGFLERYWYGRAHTFCRDFEGLGPGLLGADVRGARVIRLQGLLTRTGLYDGGETGIFGASTHSAVVAFQRSRFIEPDGQVGRLTRMVLYAAVGGYERPTLARGAS